MRKNALSAETVSASSHHEQDIGHEEECAQFWDGVRELSP